MLSNGVAAARSLTRRDQYRREQPVWVGCPRWRSAAKPASVGNGRPKGFGTASFLRTRGLPTPGMFATVCIRPEAVARSRSLFGADSSALNEQGSAFLAHTFLYRGTAQVHAMYNYLEFDCTIPRGRVLGQWLEDADGRIIKVMSGFVDWKPLPNGFVSMRAKICAGP